MCIYLGYKEIKNMYCYINKITMFSDYVLLIPNVHYTFIVHPTM